MAGDEAGVKEILEGLMQGLKSSLRASACSVYEMANCQRPQGGRQMLGTGSPPVSVLVAVSSGVCWPRSGG